MVSRSSIVFRARVHCFVVWCIVFSANQRRPCKSCDIASRKNKEEEFAKKVSEGLRRQKERAELEARVHKERLQKEIDAKREELECQQRELQAVTDEVSKRRQGLDDEIDAELGLPVKGNEENQQHSPSPENKAMGTNEQERNGNRELHESRSFGDSVKVTIKPQLPVSDTSGKFGDSVTTAITTQGQLERIRIPIFSGNKMDFQK